MSKIWKPIVKFSPLGGATRKLQIWSTRVSKTNRWRSTKRRSKKSNKLSARRASSQNRLPKLKVPLLHFFPFVFLYFGVASGWMINDVLDREEDRLSKRRKMIQAVQQEWDALQSGDTSPIGTRHLPSNDKIFWLVLGSPRMPAPLKRSGTKEELRTVEAMWDKLKKDEFTETPGPRLSRSFDNFKPIVRRSSSSQSVKRASKSARNPRKTKSRLMGR